MPAAATQGLCRTWSAIAKATVLLTMTGWAAMTLRWQSHDATVSVQSERTIIELLPYGAVRSSHGGEFDGFLDTARGSAPGTLARGSESSPGTLSTAAEAQPNKPYRATTAADRGGKGIDDDRDDALTAECLADQPTLAPPSTGDDTAVHLTHIINPFATTDLHFNFTLRSIVAAKKYAASKGIVVEVLGLTFQKDRGIPLPAEIEHLYVLDNSRSAGEQLVRLGVTLGDGEKPLQTPMVADVFRSAHRHAKSPTAIWTNYDLIVREDFYEVVHTQVSSKVGFSALRLDLLIEREKHPSLGGWTVGDVFEYGDARPQGGHDCMVFPTRWIPCLQLDRFVFGVGGWGYAVFGELTFLSKLESRGKDNGFSILKPGQHLPKSAITRHIGSQNANPARWYSNPVPWLGPLRRNQLAYNMRLKLEVEMKMSTVRDPEYICRRLIQKSCGSDRNSPTDAGFMCPHKPKGAQQPVGLAFLPPSRVENIATIIRGLTGMEMGSVHDSTLATEADKGQRVLLATHTTDLVANSQTADMLELFGTTTTPAQTTKPPRWPTPAWDAVVVLVDHDPVDSIVQLHAATGRSELPADFAEARQQLQPILAMYKAFYGFWADSALNGATLTMIVDPLGGGDPVVAAQEMLKLREAVMQIKLGYANRWCRGAPEFNVCCGVTTAFSTLSKSEPPTAGGPASPLAEWVLAELRETINAVHFAWSKSRRGVSFPDAASCCDALPAPLPRLHRQSPPPPALPKAVAVAERVSTALAEPPGQLKAPPRSPAPTHDAPAAGGDNGPAARFDKATRAHRVRRALPGLFSLLPPAYLPNHRSPCWQNESRVQCVPQFFVLGQVKCGTTDLYARIARHKAVYATVKEQHWFSREWYPGSKYIQQYSYSRRSPGGASQPRPQQLMGDGTPDYIWAHLRCLNRELKYPNDGHGVTVAEALAELNPAARLVVMFRDPVERLWSDFFYFAHRKERDLPLPPEDELDANHFHTYVQHGIQKLADCTVTASIKQCVWTARTMVFAAPTRLIMGCYGPFVEEYLAHFEREQLLTLTLDEYHDDTQATLSRVFQHIGADQPGAADWASILQREGKINQQGQRYKKLAMLDETRAALRAFYGQCNARLSDLLDDKRFLAWDRGEKAT